MRDEKKNVFYLWPGMICSDPRIDEMGQLFK